MTALTQQVADAKKKAEEEAENALALEEQRKKLAKDVEALHRQIDELQQANDKLDKSKLLRLKAYAYLDEMAENYQIFYQRIFKLISSILN